MTDLILYDAMITAIAECERVDEAKDIRDKAVALQAYYRQAGNLEAEQQAANIRLRAERKVGELLKELARATPAEAGAEGGHAKAGTSNEATRQPSAFAETLASTGMSRQQASRFQALADVPQEEFELALATGPATTAGIIARDKVHAAGGPDLTGVTREALWLWGRLRDFERDGYLDADPAELMNAMTDRMAAEVLRLAPLVSAFLTALEKENEDVTA